ncbi:MAG: hypothetical protein WBB47_14245 [Paenisporosarcina sp.]
MKKVILLTLAVLQIVLAIIMCVVGAKFAFVDDVMDRWLFVLISGVVLACILLFSNQEYLGKIFTRFVIVYPIGLIMLLILFIMDIPHYSYREAADLIEENTGEKIIEPKDSKGQLGYYYLYTNKDVFLFNSYNGEFTKREQ